MDADKAMSDYEKSPYEFIKGELLRRYSTEIYRHDEMLKILELLILLEKSQSQCEGCDKESDGRNPERNY